MRPVPWRPCISRTVYTKHLDDLDLLVFDNVPVCQYRFIDCERYVKEDVLEITASYRLPSSQYSALSYVWKGLKPNENQVSNFKVDGADDAGVIDIETLRCVCKLSLSKGAYLLWIDSICIQQRSEKDKS